MDTKEERTFKRVNNYSLWHRTLGSDYLSVDVDFVEYRAGRGVVALFGVTSGLENERHIINSLPFIFKRTTVEFKVMREIAVNLGVPAYYVIHTDDLKIFYVYKISGVEYICKIMNQEEYANFIKKL